MDKRSPDDMIMVWLRIPGLVQSAATCSARRLGRSPPIRMNRCRCLRFAPAVAFSSDTTTPVGLAGPMNCGASTENFEIGGSLMDHHGTQRSAARPKDGTRYRNCS